MYEALYLKVVPVVESSALDAVYRQLPVLIVANFSHVRGDMLMRLYESKFRALINAPNATAVMQRSIWAAQVEAARASGHQRMADARESASASTPTRPRVLETKPGRRLRDTQV